MEEPVRRGPAPIPVLWRRHPDWELCTVSGCNRPANPRLRDAACSMHQQRMARYGSYEADGRVVVKCAWCGRLSTRSRRGRRGTRRWCSNACRIAERRVRIEDWTLEDLIADVEGLCQICYDPVDLSPGPRMQPSSPSVGHRVPMSEGGDNSRANVQLEHLGCNISMGAAVH